MNRTCFAGIVICLGLTASTLAGAGSLASNANSKAGSSVAATQKRVQGIITAVDGANVTIAPLQSKRTVRARVDAAKTKVFIDGKPATLADLRVTHSAKADLGLDDVWAHIFVDSAK